MSIPPAGKPKSRVRLRPEIAKNGRAGDVFLPDALVVKFRKFWRQKASRRERPRPEDPLFCSQSRTRISSRRVQFAFRTWQVEARFDRLYPFPALRHYGDHQRLPGLEGPVSGPTVCTPRVAADDHDLHPPLGPGGLGERSPLVVLLTNRSENPWRLSCIRRFEFPTSAVHSDHAGARLRLQFRVCSTSLIGQKSILSDISLRFRSSSQPVCHFHLSRAYNLDDNRASRAQHE